VTLFLRSVVIYTVEAADRHDPISRHSLSFWWEWSFIACIELQCSRS